MTAKRKITDKSGVQVFPITHTKAVIDDNGNNVEQRLEEQMDVINQKQLEVGAVPSDLTPTAGSTNWVTSGGVYEGIKNGSKSSKYEQIPVTWTLGYFVNSSNTLVEAAGFSAAQNIDVSAYTKIIANVRANLSSKVVILDDNLSVISSLTGTLFEIDMADYPAAKYMSFSNNGVVCSGIILGLKKEEITIQESFADYIEFGGIQENYVRNVGQKLYVTPNLNVGYCINVNNVVVEITGGTNRHTDYGVIPIGATKIYYTGNSYGSVAGVLFYDKYKNMISYVNGGSNTTVYDMEFAIPPSAVYFRCSSINSYLAYHFDVMPEAVLGGNSNHVPVYNQILVTMTYGAYVDATDQINEQNNCYYVKDFDISAYAGKRIVAMISSTLSASRSLLLDENYNILYSTRNGPLDLDLANFPTAKYLSLTNYIGSGLIKYSGNVYVIEDSDESVQEILGRYYEAYGNESPAYAKMVAEMYYIEPKADVTGYYLSTNNIPVESSNGRYTSEYYLVPPTATKIYYTGVSYGSAAGVLFYDKYKNMIKAVAVGTNSTPVVNAEVNIEQGACYYRLSSMIASCSATFDNPTIPVGGNGGNDLSNYLNRKKYVAIGDSFTAPIGTEVIEEGPLAGVSKVYPYIIANRNNMTVLNQGVSGSVLNWYISTNKYSLIPEDVDYITVWYGINDQQHGISIGTVDDQPESVTSETSTSTCGGFNWLFKWLCTNRPYAKVGCIITDYSTEERRNAIIACCKKWGIAYLDIMGDPTIPMFPGGRNSNIAVSQDAVTLKQQYFNIAAGDMHPSNKCHEWQSTIIENFMRGL